MGSATPAAESAAGVGHSLGAVGRAPDRQSSRFASCHVQCSGSAVLQLPQPQCRAGKMQWALARSLFANEESHRMNSELLLYEDDYSFSLPDLCFTHVKSTRKTEMNTSIDVVKKIKGNGKAKIPLSPEKPSISTDSNDSPPRENDCRSRLFLCRAARFCAQQ